MKYSCLFILLAALATARAQTKLIPFETDGAWGYQNLEGTVVIPARYLMALEFTPGGIAAVATKKGWAYIDTAGKAVIEPFVYDNGPDYFQEGLARFVVKGKFGFFNTQGGKVIPPQFDFAEPFAEGRAAVCKGCKKEMQGEHAVWGGGRWGYIDTSGKPVIPCRYDQARPFGNNVAEVMEKGAWVQIDKNGQPVVLPKTDAVTKATPRAGAAKPEPEAPEQRISGGPEATGEYVEAAREELLLCLHPLFLQLASRTIQGQESGLPDLTKQALACHERYFQAMKGGSAITEEDVTAALAWMEERYVRLGAALLGLKAQFKQAGAGMTLQDPNFFDGTTRWKTGLVPGVPVRTDDNAVLYAYPVIPAATGAYLMPKGRPTAAQAVVCGPDLLLFIPSPADIGEKTAALWEKAAGAPRDITDKVTDARQAQAHRAFLNLILAKEKTYPEVEALRRQYKVTAVVTGGAGALKAVIHTGQEDKVPKLVRESMK